jgi:hypothetical protein
MSAVRANATTGFISGKQATSGRRVKPIARRADDDLERVADGRRIEGAQRFEGVAIGQAGHHVSPAGQGSATALGATPSGRKGFSTAPVSRIINAEDPEDAR